MGFEGEGGAGGIGGVGAGAGGRGDPGIGGSDAEFSGRLFADALNQRTGRFGRVGTEAAAKGVLRDRSFTNFWGGVAEYFGGLGGFIGGGILGTVGGPLAPATVPLGAIAGRKLGRTAVDHVLGLSGQYGVDISKDAIERAIDRINKGESPAEAFNRSTGGRESGEGRNDEFTRYLISKLNRRGA